MGKKEEEGGVVTWRWKVSVRSHTLGLDSTRATPSKSDKLQAQARLGNPRPQKKLAFPRLLTPPDLIGRS